METDYNMDDVARFNRDRWNELSAARVQYSVPALNLDASAAQAMVDPQGELGDLKRKDVLCLAAGGGQQSAAFGLLGANVTILDISEFQLDRDRETARHYGHAVRCELGDMRDLSRFPESSFDVVWQAHSINFVPNACDVFAQVVRVLRGGGSYRLEFTNPFVHGTWESSWTGSGYLFTEPYVDGEVMTVDQFWNFQDDCGVAHKIAGPREFRHTLGTIINGLVAEQLDLRGLWEDVDGDRNAAPGSWDHFKTVGAPWITVHAVKRGGQRDSATA